MNQVRIIGGTLRGRKIHFSEKPDLRPTPDRVRETVFNWLAPVIVGTQCLDAFAGSGAMGFEALSRGAKQVTLLEQCPQTAQMIQDNAVRFGLSQDLTIDIRVLDALTYLKTTTQTFDIIFLDPPFQRDLLLPAIACIAQHHLLRSEGYVYTESNVLVELDHWTSFRTKKAGNVYYQLLRSV